MRRSRGSWCRSEKSTIPGARARARVVKRAGSRMHPLGGMQMTYTRTRTGLGPTSMLLLAMLAAAAALSGFSLAARAQEPIKIGFSVSLTGGLASSGKAHLMSKQIWLEEINARGGLLGRPVKLVYYDDQTNAATVPGIYAKL